jgi:tetratricopeptide (TPR) repeat protein
VELAEVARAAEPEVARVAELVVAQAAGAERALAQEPVAARAAGLEREEAEAEESGVTRIFSRRTLQRAPLDRSGTGRSTSAFRDTAAFSVTPNSPNMPMRSRSLSATRRLSTSSTQLENPNTPRALNYRGYATRKLGRTDGGITYYLKSVALDPNCPQVREYLGEAYVIQGNFDLAKNQLATIERLCGSKECEYYKDLAEAGEGARAINDWPTRGERAVCTLRHRGQCAKCRGTQWHGGGFGGGFRPGFSTRLPPWICRFSPNFLSAKAYSGGP